MDENIVTNNEIGVVRISEEVVSVISGIAADEIEGIVGMSQGVVGGITQMFTTKKNVTKGVKVTVKEDSAEIDLYVIVKYGVKIHEVCAKVQENVKRAVESMTGLMVTAVNVYVQNVQFPHVNEVEEQEEVSEDK